jgi:hypothetical protein
MALFISYSSQDRSAVDACEPPFGEANTRFGSTKNSVVASLGGTRFWR